MALRSSEVVRRRIDRLLFLGPATALLVIFFMAPVLVDIGIAFSDMGRNLRVTQFTTGNVERMLSGDFRLAGVLTTTLIYVLCTLAIFNVSYGLVLALATTALPERTGAFFRAVWLLPRMSPSVVYALLWTWVVAPTDYGLLNQVLTASGLPLFDMKSQAPMKPLASTISSIGAWLFMSNSGRPDAVRT